LERPEELLLLRHALQSAHAGDARVVVIEGDAGLGKTSLLDLVARQAHERRLQVLHARGGSLERTLGWGVARQLFEHPVVRAAPSTRRSLLRGSAALASPVLGLDVGDPGASSAPKAAMIPGYTFTLAGSS
jgi:hypothetical protein